MNNTTMEKNTPNIEETSEEIHSGMPPADKGLVYWDLLVRTDPGERLIRQIKDLPSGDRGDVVSRLKETQLRYIERVLSDWIRVVEELLGRDNTIIRKRFVELANRWHEETDYLSSPLDITDNDNYLKIISMGESVIPHILQDLQERGGNWYRVLRILSGVDPVSPEVRGEVPKMKDAWLRWGREKGYIK